MDEATASVMVGQFDALLQPVLQAGFAGMAAVLLGIMIWLAKRVLDQADKNRTAQVDSDTRMADQVQKMSDAMAQNTLASRNLVDAMNVQTAELRKLAEELMTRPCLSMRDS